MMKTLVLGIGNSIVTDDAIGLKVIAALQDKNVRPDFDYATAEVGGMDLLYVLEGYDRAICIDSIKTKDGVPGEIYAMTLDDFKESLHLSNIHDVNFATAIELGRRTGMKLPDVINIYAIEIVDNETFGEELTPQLAERFDDIVAEIAVEIEGL